MLEGDDIRAYRSVLDKLLYLSHYRYDLQYHVRGLCQSMQNPTCGGMRALKHLVRYCKGTESMALYFPAGTRAREISVYADSNWAGSDDPQRRSVSSGIVLMDRCPLVTWSRTQASCSVALSSGEAEFMAAVTAIIEALGVAAVLEEINIVLPITIYTDSTVCLSVLNRLGAGSRLKHVQTKLFFVQELVRSGRIKTCKVDTKENPADIGTKSLGASVLQPPFPQSRYEDEP